MNTIVNDLKSPECALWSSSNDRYIISIVFRTDIESDRSRIIARDAIEYRAEINVAFLSLPFFQINDITAWMNVVKL